MELEDVDGSHSPTLPPLCSTLCPGAKFVGFQASGDGLRKHEVEVCIKEVDLARSFVSGDLLIRGLTKEYPELITFFDAEVVGDRFSFVTAKWGAKKEVDEEHWRRFQAFRDFERKSPDCLDRSFRFDYLKSDYIFMRWKEHFLVPDHKVDTIMGASFAGFYYICFRRSNGRIEGLYYGSTSTEPFQKLTLEMINETKFASFEYR
eukprot:m.10040 g.10040  ORF g.10040 m.10040 type:complete len:205 (+) comp8078_c0_seq1:426-1040(+)